MWAIAGGSNALWLKGHPAHWAAAVIAPRARLQGIDSDEALVLRRPGSGTDAPGRGDEVPVEVNGVGAACEIVR